MSSAERQHEHVARAKCVPAPGWVQAILLVVATFVTALHAQLPVAPQDAKVSSEWPQWRGPQRDGVWRDTGIARTFSTESMAPEWGQPIGPGFAGPAVAGGRVFVTDRQAAEDKERVLALDEKTGRVLWTFDYVAEYIGVDYASGPRATPTADGGRIYTKGAMGHLFCLDAASGREIWSVDLVSQFGARVPTWGMAGAPLIDGERLIVNVGGPTGASVVAFNKHNGEVRWQALDDRPGYAPPIIISAAGRRQLICWSAEAVNSLDPETGSSYWRVPFRDRADMTICCPVQFGDYLFVSSYYGGSMLLSLDDDHPDASVVWRDKKGDTPRLSLCISTPLVRNGYLYAVDRSGMLRCLDPADGRLLWETDKATGGKEHGNAHMVSNGDCQYLFNELGQLVVTQFDSSGYHELSRTQVISPTPDINDDRPVTWSHPAFANGRIFVRNDQEIRCVKLK